VVKFVGYTANFTKKFDVIIDGAIIFLSMKLPIQLMMQMTIKFLSLGSLVTLIPS
jgi:hypothetical protein